MSEPGDLLKAAMYAWKTEKDRKRALNLAQQVIQRYPDSREVDMAQVIVTKLKPNPEWNESEESQSPRKSGCLKWFLVIALGIGIAFLIFAEQIFCAAFFWLPPECR